MSESAAYAPGDGGSTIASLRRPADGLLARLALVDGAERTLDLQYYLWDSDVVGYLLLSRLLAAADRGVDVRVLVDDLKLPERTRSIASLCRHSNLEIRVFNPWQHRSSAVAQTFEFVRRFQALDRRMHNKLLIADDERAIFGGRNIAAEHFGSGTTFNLVDHDLLLTGEQAVDLARVFERYWESPVSGTAASFDVSVSDDDLAARRALVAVELEKRSTILSAVLAEEARWDHRSAPVGMPIARGAISVVSDTPGVSEESRPSSN